LGAFALATNEETDVETAEMGCELEGFVGYLSSQFTGGTDDEGADVVSGVSFDGFASKFLIIGKTCFGCGTIAGLL